MPIPVLYIIRAENKHPQMFILANFHSNKDVTEMVLFSTPYQLMKPTNAYSSCIRYQQFRWNPQAVSRICHDHYKIRPDLVSKSMISHQKTKLPIVPNMLGFGGVQRY